jgi:hypothetical protein
MHLETSKVEENKFVDAHLIKHKKHYHKEVEIRKSTSIKKYYF